MCVSARRHACTMLNTWRSEDSLSESVLSFRRVGPEYWIQVLGFSDKCFLPNELFLWLDLYSHKVDWCSLLYRGLNSIANTSAKTQVSNQDPASQMLSLALVWNVQQA